MQLATSEVTPDKRIGIGFIAMNSPLFLQSILTEVTMAFLLRKSVTDKL